MMTTISELGKVTAGLYVRITFIKWVVQNVERYSPGPASKQTVVNAIFRGQFRLVRSEQSLFHRANAQCQPCVHGARP